MFVRNGNLIVAYRHGITLTSCHHEREITSS